jgi:hypothetical protein
LAEGICRANLEAVEPLARVGLRKGMRLRRDEANALEQRSRL